MTTGRLDKDRILAQLTTARVGRTLELFERLDSTNRYILEQLSRPDYDGLVVLAESQSAGRGRRGRSWHCPSGAGVLCTVGIRDSDDEIDPAGLALIVPIAVCDALRAESDVHCEIRWPNDLVVRGSKVGGVLIESREDRNGARCYAVGIGINCLQHRRHFPEELRATATSLDIESVRPVNREHVVVGILAALDPWLARPHEWSTLQFRARWKNLACGLGTRMRLEHEGRVFEGILLDIDPSAAILVQLDGGGRRLFSAMNTSILKQLD